MANAISTIRPLKDGVSPWFRGPTTRDLVARHGRKCQAGTFEFETASGVYTELQCGSYIFLNADCGRSLGRAEPTRVFDPILFVSATVMSRPAEDRVIIDAGLKALVFDSRPPLVCDEPAMTCEHVSGEHGRH